MRKQSLFSTTLPLASLSVRRWWWLSFFIFICTDWLLGREGNCGVNFIPLFNKPHYPLWDSSYPSSAMCMRLITFSLPSCMPIITLLTCKYSAPSSVSSAPGSMKEKRYDLGSKEPCGNNVYKRCFSIPSTVHVHTQHTHSELVMKWLQTVQPMAS